MNIQNNNQEIAPQLQIFVDGVSKLLDQNQNEAEFHPQIGELLAELVREDNWLEDKYTVPHPEYYQQLLLYVDPEERFSIVSFVWGPGQETPIHNHTVWGVIGMLRGKECEQAFEIDEDNSLVLKGDEITLSPRDIGFVSPTIGDVHRVRNFFDDQTSISIHIYGGDIGKIKRNVFPADGSEKKDFISGYSTPAVN